MGNDGAPEFVAPVALHVGHPDWLLRAHAVWALGRLGGPAVSPVLTYQLPRERRPEVRAEIEAVLGS